MYWRYIPNLLTCLRFLLVGPVLAALLTEHYRVAFYCFVVAGCTDGLDGLLARLNGWTSRFGAIADPLADKILLMGSFAALGWLGKIPLWLVAIVIARDAWILMGVFVYRYFISEPEFKPSGISKINTFLQLILIMLLLIDLSFTPLPELVFNALILGVLITTVASCVHYTWAWSWRARADYQLKIQQRKSIAGRQGEKA